MDNQKIGEYITTLRKNKNLTQKELAESLGVTDKAVSKWERGAGYPDISMLRPLADILGTSVNELLEGEANPVTLDDTKDITNALTYANKIITIKQNKWSNIIAASFTICLLIAIFASVIVNIAINQELTWSLIVISSCVLGGMIILPILLKKKRGILYSLCFITLFTVPLLCIIQLVSNGNRGGTQWLIKLGLPISITWLCFIWLIVLLVKKSVFNLWFNIAFASILCIPCHLITNYFVSLFVKNVHNNFDITRNIITIIGYLAVSSICFIIGLSKRIIKTS